MPARVMTTVALASIEHRLSPRRAKGRRSRRQASPRLSFSALCLQPADDLGDQGGGALAGLGEGEVRELA